MDDATLTIVALSAAGVALGALVLALVAQLRLARVPADTAPAHRTKDAS